MASPDDRGIWLRVTFLEDELLDPIVSRFLQSGAMPLRLGPCLMTVHRMITTTEESPLAGHTNFDALLAPKYAATEINLTFGSPTAFSLGQLPNGKRRMSLLPEPPLIFDSLLRKWNEFVPQADLRLDPALRQQVEQYCIVSQHRLYSEPFQFPRHAQAGFIRLAL